MRFVAALRPQALGAMARAPPDPATGRTALHVACDLGLPTAVRDLLRAGADPLARRPSDPQLSHTARLSHPAYPARIWRILRIYLTFFRRAITRVSCGNVMSIQYIDTIYRYDI